MLIVNPAYPEVSEHWFDPAHWGDRASRVSAGGRGSAWFVDTPHGDMVLRHYRRGGMAARISERRYVYTGWKRTRAYREYQLLAQFYDQGLPVPEPVAAAASRNALSYEAAIMIRRIANAVPMPEVPDLADEALWRKVGRIIRNFHDAGLDHVDLNCDNILVAGEKVYLIDFDRCRLRARPSGVTPWMTRNAERLLRSVSKRCVTISSSERQHLWGILKQAYLSA